ncbi:MAG: hypothetical protein M3Q65_15715 [Chloroflexota bacterium]|nr:hypothetical protein [Chloroflexota bacterium]
MPYLLHCADCLEWLADEPEASYEAIVTDPPYGLKEYSTKEQTKLRGGNRGGIWRIPPALNGSTRAPLPRFTVLTQQDVADLSRFFRLWGAAALRAAVPGAHLFIATNPFLSHVLYAALAEAGWEKRGEIVRLVQTLKGGDRPKNAEAEFPDVTVMPARPGNHGGCSADRSTVVCKTTCGAGEPAGCGVSPTSARSRT